MGTIGRLDLQYAGGRSDGAWIWTVLSKTLGQGEAKARPLIARHDLAGTFITPALAFIEAHGGAMRTGARLKRLEIDNESVVGLTFDDGEIPLSDMDHVVLALPPVRPPVRAYSNPGVSDLSDSRSLPNDEPMAPGR